MAVQRNIIQKVMRILNNTSNSDVTQLLNYAVISCQGKYTTVQQVIDDCTYKCSVAKKYNDFLKNDCGIDLTNEELGPLVGFDTSGYTSMLIRNTISEDKISELTMPFPNIIKYNMLEVHYPAFSGLTPEQRFIVSALHTWWIPRALNLLALSIGYEFNYTDAVPRVLNVEFTTEPAGVLAHIDYLSDTATGKTTNITLKINMTMYNTVLVTDPNGVTSAYGTNIPSLDRTIAYEFVKAVEATNIDYFNKLDTDYKWFIEGSKELVRGIDDKIRANIIDLASNSVRLASAFTSSPVGEQDIGSAGYILLRFFAKQISEFYNIEYVPKRHLMSERGNVKTLKELGEKFLAFAQRRNNNVQAWELVDSRLSSFYGATLRVPMTGWHDSQTGDRYFLFTSSILQKQPGSAQNNFIDILKLKYPLALISENYSLSTLYEINTWLSKSPEIIYKKSHIMFSGCELDLIHRGDSPLTVINHIKNLAGHFRNYGVQPTLLITPIVEMYVSGKIVDSYKIFLRNSYISGKINMVCLGDSITAVNGDGSWTDYCQEKLPKSFIINKGVNNTTTAQALARFTTDVVEQVPDLCFILIGQEDLWNATSTDMDTIKADWKQLVDNCISNNIIPIIGLYDPTMQQIEQFISTLPSGSHQDKIQVRINFMDFYEYCESIAKEYNLITVDVYHDLKNIDNSIGLNNISVDGMTLSEQGMEKMGYYIANELKEFIWDKQSQLSQNYDIVNIYDIFCTNLGVDELSQTDLESMLDVDKLHYKDGAPIDYITNYIYGNELLVPSNRAYFYVALEHMNVTSQTYSKWLRTGQNTMLLDIFEEYSAHDKTRDDEYSDFNTKIYYQSEKYDHSVDRPSTIRHVFGKYGGTDSENAFKNTGEFLAIGLHRTFDSGLWMCEQGGITCTKEAMTQINDLNLVPWRSSITPRVGGITSEGPHVRLPVFPGTGCPWLTVSDQNKSEFSVATRGIDYWFTKSDCDATITIRFNKGGSDSDVYQSISLGMLSNVPRESYPFPLYVAGGNQALSQDLYKYVPIYGSVPTYVVGNIYDLDVRNICLSNSNLLHPTKFNGANMSNFRILSPEGEWKDIYGHFQGITVQGYHDCSGRVENWGAILQPVTFNASGYHSSPQFSTDTRYRVDTYTVNRRLNQYEHSSSLDKIVVFIDNSLAHQETGVEGIIPNCFQSWYRTLPVGEIDIDGKKYLSVPNGWDGRLWNYPWFLGVYNDPTYWSNESIRYRWDMLHKVTVQNMMVDRLMIPLEEKDN